MSTCSCFQVCPAAAMRYTSVAEFSSVDYLPLRVINYQLDLKLLYKFECSCKIIDHGEGAIV